MRRNLIASLVLGAALVGLAACGDEEGSSALREIERQDRDVAAAAEAFLAEARAAEGAEALPSGLVFSLATPSPDAQVLVPYEGTLKDGTVFDSSLARGEPAVFGVNQVIAGFAEGLMRMRPGDEAILTIPPELGYGRSSAGQIPPNSALQFKVQLLGVATAEGQVVYAPGFDSEGGQ